MRNIDVKKLSGVVPPLVTPLKEDETIDEEGLRFLVNHSIENGLHAMLIAGSNGESMGITAKQRDNSIRIAINEAKGRVPVFCGIMDTSTVRVIENIKRLEQMGGEYAVITPVFYTRFSCQDEIIRHFETIAQNTDMNIILYNIPIFTSVNILPDTVVKLSQIDNVVGLKCSHNDFIQFQKTLQNFKEKDFMLYQGTTNMAGPCMLLGAHGCVPVLAPLYPKLFISLYEAAKAKNVDEVFRLQKLVCKVGEILSMGKNATSAAKYALSLLGKFSMRVSAPSEPLAADEIMNIKNHIAMLNEMVV